MGLFLLLALVLRAAAPVAAETYVYTGMLGKVGHDNGMMGLAQWRVYGTDFGDLREGP